MSPAVRVSGSSYGAVWCEYSSADTAPDVAPWTRAPMRMLVVFFSTQPSRCRTHDKRHGRQRQRSSRLPLRFAGSALRAALVQRWCSSPAGTAWCRWCRWCRRCGSKRCSKRVVQLERVLAASETASLLPFAGGGFALLRERDRASELWRPLFRVLAAQQGELAGRKERVASRRSPAQQACSSVVQGTGRYSVMHRPQCARQLSMTQIYLSAGKTHKRKGQMATG